MKSSQDNFQTDRPSLRILSNDGVGADTRREVHRREKPAAAPRHAHLVQEELFAPEGLLSVAANPLALELHYHNAVQEVRAATTLRRRIPELALAAIRAGAQAAISQVQVARDLRMSKAKVSEMLGVVRLLDDLAREGIEVPDGVSVSHLEVLAPLGHDRQRALLAMLRESRCSVARLRAHARTEAAAGPGGLDHDLLARHLGRWLRKGWQNHRAELLEAIRRVADEVPMGTAAVPEARA